MIANPDKLSNNSSYFIKKITFAIAVGGLGIWLIQTTSDNKDTTESLEKGAE